MAPAARHRPRWRAFLLLARVSNLPTVWSNVLAGFVGAGSIALTADADMRILPPLVSLSLFYTGGMFLNDAFDAAHDAVARPERPIPAGDVALREAFTVGMAVLVAGELLLWRAGFAALALGALLAAAIVVYDRSHKGNPVAPLVMGACRGLVYLIAAAVAGAVTVSVAVGASVVTAYVVSLTVVARRAGRNARWLVPLLIAGISLVDAAFLLVIAPERPILAAVAALGFPLTLALQRWVPGD